MTRANRITAASVLNDKSVAPGSPQPFSHMQWYLSHARNTVHFAAQTSRELSEKDFHNLVELIMSWAPQLGTRADIGRNRHIAVDIDHRRICRYETTYDLDRSLAETVAVDNQIFCDPSLPDFRAYCFRLARRNDNGPQTLVVCSTSHALMEGSETSRLMRSRRSVHGAGQTTARLGALQHAVITGAGIALAPFHLVASSFNRTEPTAGRAAAFDIDRQSIKSLAARLSVRQRSVLFTLPLFALDPAENKARKRAHLVSYSSLPDIRTTLEDSTLNLRMQVGRFPTADSFEAQVLRTEAVLAREDTKELYSQAIYNSILAVHRKLQKPLPFLYRQRFFTYVPYDFVLSLLPPHFSGGILRGMFDGSVFCGSYTPGVNSCVFVPHRTGISINLFTRPPVLHRLDRFPEALEQLGIGCRRIF